MQNKRKPVVKKSAAALQRNVGKAVREANKARNQKPTVRTEAKVAVKKTVNGTATRKAASSGVRRGHRNSNVQVSQFPKDLLIDVQAKVRPGEKLVVISDTEARTEYLK